MFEKYDFGRSVNLISHYYVPPSPRPNFWTLRQSWYSKNTPYISCQNCFFRLKSKQGLGKIGCYEWYTTFLFYSPQTDFVWRQLIIDWEILKTPIRKVDKGAAETLETPEVAPQPTQSGLPAKPTRIDPQSLWINRLCLDSNSIQAIQEMLPRLLSQWLLMLRLHQWREKLTIKIYLFFPHISTYYLPNYSIQ